jgi:hypothetical protein
MAMDPRLQRQVRGDSCLAVSVDVCLCALCADERRDMIRQNLFLSASCNGIILRNVSAAAVCSQEGKQHIQHALDALSRLQEIRQTGTQDGSKSMEVEFLLRFEVPPSPCLGIYRCVHSGLHAP